MSGFVLGTAFKYFIILFFACMCKTNYVTKYYKLFLQRAYSDMQDVLCFNMDMLHFECLV